MTNETPISVLYHADCQDGLIASFLLYMFILNNYGTNGVEQTEFIAVRYNKPLPKVNGKIVFIADFSYPRSVIDSLTQSGKNVIMFDHHKTAADMYGGYCEKCVEPSQKALGKGAFTRLLVKEQSGALIVLNWIKAKSHVDIYKHHWSNDTFINWLVTRVSDRDLWNFEYSDSKLVHEFIAREFKDYASFSWLMYFDFKGRDETVSKKLEQARITLEFKQTLIENLAKTASEFTFEGYNCLYVNSPLDYFSDVADYILGNNTCDMVITCVLSPTQAYWRMRSRKDSAVNVRLLAERMGSGGHDAAASFYTSIETAKEIFNHEYRHIWFAVKLTDGVIDLTHPSERLYPNGDISELEVTPGYTFITELQLNKLLNGK